MTQETETPESVEAVIEAALNALSTEPQTKADGLTADTEAVRMLREALGAHIQADAYRDTMPDDDEDAAYLDKQETWWRLQARAWVGEELSYECAEMAKRRACDTPEHKAMVQALLERTSDNG